VNPNFVAYVALLAYPIVVFALYRRTTAVAATTWSMLLAAMFLPEWAAFDPPVLPPLDKSSLTSIYVMVALLVGSRERLSAARIFRGVDRLFLVSIAGLVCTVAVNGDELIFGPRYIQGMVPWDAVSYSLADTLGLFLPFFIGRAMFRGSKDLHTFFRVLVTAGMIYAAFCLFEVRFSPQTHRWIYGIHQMDFAMTYRGGGYRPMVCMRTGIAVAMFMLTTAMAAVALARSSPLRGLTVPRWKPAYLTIVLLLCKSTGAITYGLFVLPLLAFMRRARVRLAVVLAVFLMSFPLLRISQVFPTDAVVSGFEAVAGQERSLSLWFRFWNEDELLAHARDRFWFGWGGYGRFRIYDPFTGQDLSVTDGDWTIVLGSRGLVGFVSIYALLVAGIFLAARRLQRIPDPKDRRLVAALALIVAVNALDLIPNGLFHTLPYFYAGVLWGVLEGNQFAAPSTAPDKEAARRARREARRAASA
jgi:hypothetical protein